MKAWLVHVAVLQT